jgi:hypothetical protein
VRWVARLLAPRRERVRSTQQSRQISTMAKTLRMSPLISPYGALDTNIVVFTLIFLTIAGIVIYLQNRNR